jgi:CDP-glucose 4,6-dehydratase
MGKRQGAMESMVMNAGFWKNKKVFLTGHTGFKGSWLSLWLQSLGANVTGYSIDIPSKPSLFEVAKVAQDMTSLQGDICDLAALNKAMQKSKPEIVIHMAAQSLVHYGYDNPVETYATNVLGTVHVLEAIRQTQSVKAAVMVTSDKCYENREWVWGYRENEPMGGYDPYSNSKGCAELVTSSYRQSYFKAKTGPAIASARAGNVIGGGDWAADRLIPDMIRAIGAGKSVKIRRPHSIRPWQHVMEPLSGYLLLAEKLYKDGAAYAEGWNFGPREEDAKPVEWIVEHITRLWGKGARWSKDKTRHPHEAHYLKLDCSKAHMRLHWKPRWSLLQALEAITTWHKAHNSKANMRDFTLQQIKTYQKAIQ